MADQGKKRGNKEHIVPPGLSLSMLQGKTAIITGASRGIGKAIALTFARHGAFVGINYATQKDKAEHVLHAIEDMNQEGVLLPGDVSTDAPRIKDTVSYTHLRAHET